MSYAQKDRSWAEWIAWILEEDGYRVLVQAWDFVPGTHWVQGMQAGTRDAARTIAVLSADYLASVYGGAEWQAAWASDPQGTGRRLLTVWVADCDRPGLLAGVVGVDLVGLDQTAARTRLRDMVAAAVAGRAKPDVPPAFPGTERAMPHIARFPGSGGASGQLDADDIVSPSRPVAESNALDLGVHRAIDTEADAELPPYIFRSHDRELRELLSGTDAPSVVILVGGSCTGKTRACFEAVRDCLGSWQMFHPADAPELEQLLSGQRAGRRTVIWLDEAHRYLDERRQRGAGAVQCLQRALIGATGPLVIGSMRAKSWAELAAEPQEGQQDLHPHVRRLLGMRAVRKIEVPEDFSSAEPADLRELALAADHDPRVAAAQRAGGDRLQITQVLAGGVLMRDRYLHPSDIPSHIYSKAIVTAAMDARRVGHWDAIPPLLLAEAVPGYLTASQRAAPADWFGSALSVAAERVHGIRSLTPVRHRSGVGGRDGYLLHDYLDEYARTTREGERPPASLWDSVLAHTATVADLTRIAAEAKERGLYRYAVLAAARAAEANDTGAMLFVARLLDETGRAEECVTWLWPFAEANKQDAMLFLSDELVKSSRENRYTESVLWVRRAAESGSARAMWKLGELLGREDVAVRAPELAEEGIRWLGRLAQGGDLRAMQRLAKLLGYIGRTDEAAAWRDQLARHRRSMVPSDSERLAKALRITDELLETGKVKEDIPALRSQASAGDLRAMERLGIRLDKAGETEEAMAWLAKAAESGEYHAAWELARILHRADREDEALAAIQRAAACWADTWIAFELVLPWLKRVGGQLSLESFLQTAAGTGNSWATAYLAPELARNGQTAEAIHKLWAAAGRKNIAAMEFLGVLLEQANLGTESHAWYQRVDEAGAGWLLILASMLENAGWLERALIRYRNAVECKEAWAMESLTGLLKKMNRTEEAHRLRTLGIDAGGRTAQSWQVPSSDSFAVLASAE